MCLLSENLYIFCTFHNAISGLFPGSSLLTHPCPDHRFEDYTDAFLFYREAISDLHYIPSCDVCPGQHNRAVEYWAAFLDARGLKVGDKPHIDGPLLKKIRKPDRQIDTTVFGVHCPNTSLGSHPGAILFTS